MEGTTTLGISGIFSELLTLAGDVLEMIQANPLLLVYFAAGLLFMAIGIIKRLKQKIVGGGWMLTAYIFGGLYER